MKQRGFIKTIKEKGDTKMNNEKIYSLRLTESEIMDIKNCICQEILNLKQIKNKRNEIESKLAIENNINDLKKLLNVINIQKR